MFYNRLRELRNGYSMSQKELANKLFVSQQTIAKWETNKASPNPEMLSKIASFFQVSVDYLVGSSDEKEKPTTPEDDELAKLLEDPELRQIYDRLVQFNDDELADILKYCEFLASKRETPTK